jgi:hypothetical protein
MILLKIAKLALDDNHSLTIDYSYYLVYVVISTPGEHASHYTTDMARVNKYVRNKDMLSKIILRSNPNTRRVLCFNEYDVVNE